jgi:3-oxoacyl-[acyl-carrier-protein] synthase-3
MESMANRKSDRFPLEARIVGTGSYLPEKVLTNQDLEKMVDTSDEWIITRTGIRERHIAAEGEAVSHMSAKAAERALEAAGLAAEDLDMIIVGTFTGDLPLPATACFVQRHLGIPHVPAFDIAAACTAFLYGLAIAKQFVATGMYKNILVVGADKLTAFTDWTDRNTCVLFGDGAGAAIVGSEGEGPVLGSFDLGAEGELTHLIHVPVGGSLSPFSHENAQDKGQYIKMEGRELFKAAVQKMEETVRNTLRQANVEIKDIRAIIPHQANVRILQAVTKNLRFDMDKVHLNLEKYGNTSAAATPICFDEFLRNNSFSQGDKAILVAFGGGFTYGSCLVEW